MFELLQLLSSAVRHGGSPRAVRDRYGRPGLEYPIRPGNRLLTLAVLAGSASVLGLHWSRIVRGQWRSLPWGWLLWCAAVSGMLLIVQLRRVRVDEQGLSVRYPLGANKLIRWDDLSHFERYRMQSSGDDLYYFRSRPDPSTGAQTTISMSEMSYDLPDLVREMRSRVDLPEWPRQKKHWWGG